MKACSIQGCDRPSVARGWCRAHWKRWRKHGDTSIVLPPGRVPKAPPPCSIDGCELPAKTRSWCGKHYTRWFRHGDPLVDGNQQRATSHPIARIIRRTEPVDGCWLYRGPVTPGGYGTIGVRRVTQYVHRLMYEWAHGPIPHGFHVDHLCFVRHCVNPAHLEAVTPKENNRRALARKQGGNA